MTVRHADRPYPAESARSPEEVVDAIIRARGDQAAFLQAAFGGLRRQIWSDDWRFAERIVRVLQDRGRQGHLNALERNSLIGHFVSGAEEARAEENPRFHEICAEMDRIERECTGSDDGMLLLDDAPQSFRDLDREYRELLARSTVDWLNELEEPELARLADEQPEAFEHMITAGHVMIGLGTDDVDAVLDYEAPPDADLTAGLAVITTMRGTSKAAEIFRDLVTGLWRSADDVHAVATARFAQMLAAAGQLDDNERFFVVSALAKPMALTSALTDSTFVEMLTRLEIKPKGRTTVEKEVVTNLLQFEARWLDDVDSDMAAVLRADRAEYERRCAAGGRSLLGDFVEEAKVNLSSV